MKLSTEAAYKQFVESALNTAADRADQGGLYILRQCLLSCLNAYVHGDIDEFKRRLDQCITYTHIAEAAGTPVAKKEAREIFYELQQLEE